MPLRGRRQSSFEGVWGRKPPRYPLHTTRIIRPDPKISGKVRITNRRFRKMSGSAALDSQKRPVRDQAISKKIGRPLPPMVRSAKKPIGPIDLKTGQGGLFYSSATTCASTGVPDETGWSVRPISKLIGAIISAHGSGSSPPPPALCSAKKNDRTDRSQNRSTQPPLSAKTGGTPMIISGKTLTQPLEVLQKNDRVTIFKDSGK